MINQTISLDCIGFLGSGLVRPESVVTHASGLVFASDWAGPGGIAVVAANGSVTRIPATCDVTDPLRPNGIALERGGTFLVAHLGSETGGLFRLHSDGALQPVLTDIDGVPLPPSNFPLIDSQGRIWLTISTRVTPRARDYRADASSGFIVLIDKTGARIVADGLGYTNECILSGDERTLFVNETFTRCLTRFSVGDDGSLFDRAVVAKFGPGTFPDGLVRDADDHLWITSIVSNRVIRVAPSGQQSVIFEESEPAHLADVEAAFSANAMGRSHLDCSPAQTLRNVSSLAFGGPGLRQAYMGCLLGDRITRFDAPVAGVPHANFNADLGPLHSLKEHS